MWNIVVQWVIQLIDLMPGLIALTLMFDFLGSFIFGKR